MRPFDTSGTHKLITVGALMKNLFDSVTKDKRLSHFPDYKAAKEAILALIENGDCLLFKGSRKTKIHEIVKYLKTQAV